MLDLASRLDNRIQLTTDGLSIYPLAVESAFFGELDYAQIQKIYRASVGASNERRYSPAVCTGITKKVMAGDPDMGVASTSYVERQNLTMRMGMRRFTNGFSKKVENLAHAVSLQLPKHYNFAQPHKALTKAANGSPNTPAMAAGVVPRLDAYRNRSPARLARLAGRDSAEGRGSHAHCSLVDILRCDITHSELGVDLHDVINVLLRQLSLRGLLHAHPSSPSIGDPGLDPRTTCTNICS